MANSTFSERLREINKLIGAEGRREDILGNASQLKDDIRNEMQAMWAVVFALDNLVAVFAPDPQWQIGLWPDASTATPASTPRPPRYNRTDRTLEIARTLSEGGATMVVTEEIAKRLQSEGDTSSVKDLTTAVGNILTRSGVWQRVAPGEYMSVKGDATQQ